MSVKTMLVQARQSLGLGEPNHIQRWYTRRHGSAYAYNFPWCAAAVTYWAHKSGNPAAVLPAGDRAYTPWFAQDFEKIGRWRTGTATSIRRHARPGDIVFFDWSGSNTIGRIDHVGVVERNLGDGRVQTIEANTADACKRRVRGPGVIAGFGQPAYAATSTTTMGDDVIGLTQGDKGEQVKGLQAALVYAGYDLEVDGDYGPKTATALLHMRKDLGSSADSGDRLTGWAYGQLMKAIAKRQGGGERGSAGPPGPQGPPGELPGDITVTGTLSVEATA